MYCNGIGNKSALTPIFRGKRLGLITNPTGTDAQLRSTAELLKQNFTLEAVFGPEHGIRGDMQASLKSDIPAVDPELGVRSYSLYAETRRPTDAMLDGIDMLVYDIQDVGARFYTYISTLGYAMEECAKRSIPMTVLDRANPIGGIATEGTLLRKQFRSFVGDAEVPTRYALTVGEYAAWHNATADLGCELNVIPCLGWKRDLFNYGTQLPWIMPSPNIPTRDTAFAYIGTCLFEGTNISEGRGTTHPFEIIGAPFVDARRLANAMEQYNLPGLLWRPVHFIPTFSKYAGTLCHGVQLHITEPALFPSFEAGLSLFHEIREQCGDKMTFTNSLDRLFGDDCLRLGTEDIPHIIQRARRESDDFAASVRKYHLYN